MNKGEPITTGGVKIVVTFDDDETKEVILSPGSYHEFEGTLQVALKRQADMFVDFENEDSFEELK